MVREVQRGKSEGRFVGPIVRVNTFFYNIVSEKTIVKIISEKKFLYL